MTVERKPPFALQEDIAAVACLDEGCGFLLGVYAEGDAPPGNAADVVHALLPVPQRPGLAMLGIARGGPEVGLSSVLDELAERVSRIG